MVRVCIILKCKQEIYDYYTRPYSLRTPKDSELFQYALQLSNHLDNSDKYANAGYNYIKNLSAAANPRYWQGFSSLNELAQRAAEIKRQQAGALNLPDLSGFAAQNQNSEPMAEFKRLYEYSQKVEQQRQEAKKQLAQLVNNQQMNQAQQYSIKGEPTGFAGKITPVTKKISSNVQKKEEHSKITPFKGSLANGTKFIGVMINPKNTFHIVTLKQRINIDQMIEGYKSKDNIVILNGTQLEEIKNAPNKFKPQGIIINQGQLYSEDYPKEYQSKSFFGIDKNNKAVILTDNAQNRNPNNFKFGVGGLVPVYLNDTKEEYEHYLTSIGMHGATTNHWTDITGLVVTPKNNIVIIHTMSSEIENARQAIRLFILKNYGQDALKDSISGNSPFYTKNEKDKELKLYPVSYNSLTDFLNKLAPWKKDIHGNDIIDDPKFDIPKKYKVLIKGKFTFEHAEKFAKGIDIGDGQIAYATVLELKHEKDNVISVKIELTQGFNRQIRRMIENIGSEVVGLKRLSIGPMNLKNLKKGEYSVLQAKEIKQLMDYLDNKLSEVSS